MSDNYRVRVLALDPAARRVTFRIFLVDYDLPGVPTDPSFFMRVLWDQADTRFGGGPLGHEVSLDQKLDEKWVDANAQRFVERVTRTSVRNDPPSGKRPAAPFDEDILTQGDYDVVVTDAKWLDHLSVGQTWETTAYDSKAKMPRGRKTVLADWEAKAKARKAGPAMLVDAIDTADLDAIRTLVANGARLNPSYETFGAFPLATACDLVQSAGSPAMRVVKLLVDLGADVNHRASTFQAPPLFTTAYRGNGFLARWLIGNGASLDGVDPSDAHLVLHCAAAGGLPWLVDLCLARGQGPNEESRQGHRVIHYAFITPQWKPIAEALERAGADLTHQSNSWGTALHWAALHGLADAVPWLVARGISIDTPSLERGETPLLKAAESRAPERARDTIAELIAHGADVNARTPDGVTALHVAAGQISSQAVAALLAAGADKSLKTTSPWPCGSTRFKAGVTPREVAARMKRPEAEALLR